MNKDNKKLYQKNKQDSSEIENLKREISLLDFVKNDGCEVKKKGNDYVTRCPFHEDTNASLTITPSKNLWHCFGCAKGGSIIDWVMTKNNIDCRKAIAILRQQFSHLAAKTTATPTTKTSPPLKPKKPPVNITDKSNQQLLKKVVQFYNKQLHETPVALEFLEKRGLQHPELIDHFQLGFATRTLSKLLPKGNKGKKIKEQLTDIGIYRESGHEQFRGSLVIPIINEKGEITEAYGRKINNKLRTGTPYHLYLKGPHRGIFNPECLQSKKIILCEALIDALSFWVHDFRNVTSSYGTQGFTEDHLKAFTFHKIEEVYIAYDSDRAGDAAAAKVAEKLLAHDIMCYRVKFPADMDANDFICQKDFKRSLLQELLEKAIPLGNVKKQEALKSVAAKENTAKEKIAVKTSIADVPYKWLGDDVMFSFEDRLYRVRRLKKNLSYDFLRINIRVMQGDHLHVDTIELLNARQRDNFVNTTANELNIRKEIIKRDIGRMLLKLEELQRDIIEQTLNPQKKEVKLTKKEYQEAMAFLKTRNLKERICQDFIRCGLVGEEINSFLTYLSLTSRSFARVNRYH